MPSQTIDRQTWFEKIEAYESSGQSQKQFCIDNHLSYSSFQYYRKRFLEISSEKNPNESQKNGFVTLSMPNAAAVQAAFQLVLPNGIKLTVPRCFNPNRLLELLEVLKRC